MRAETDILLVTVTNKETNAVLTEFERLTGKKAELRQKGDRSYMEIGEINGQRIWHMRCQMGSIGVGSSQQDVTKAVFALQPRAVIMVGIAMGAGKESQKIGDILISRKLALYEQARVGEGTIIRGDRASASGFLLSRFQTAGILWNPEPPVNVEVGLILTGEKLVDDPTFRAHLLGFEPEAIGLEMEGAGVYATCVDAGIPWIVIKSICDWGDGNKNNKDKEPNQQLAAKNAAEFVGHVLGIKPPLFFPLAKAAGPVIAHLYWLGSDLADGLRHVVEGQPISTLEKIVSQAARHFRKYGFEFESIQDGLEHFEQWLGQLPPGHWPQDQNLRQQTFNQLSKLKSQVDVFINSEAGPDFDPHSG